MTDLLLHDIDPALAERIRRVAETNGWTLHQTILHLIERGLYASEGGTMRFDNRESDLLQGLIAAMEELPNDAGYALIGRVQTTGADAASTELASTEAAGAVEDAEPMPAFGAEHDEEVQSGEINPDPALHAFVRDVPTGHTR